MLYNASNVLLRTDVVLNGQLNSDDICNQPTCFSYKAYYTNTAFEFMHIINFIKFAQYIKISYVERFSDK